MAQYIDKDKAITEIEKAVDEPAPSHDQQYPWEDGYYCGLYKAEGIIDTLEVKEADLEKHLKEDIEDVFFDLDGVAIKGATHYLTVEDVKDIAKHFFELGLKVKQESNDEVKVGETQIYMQQPYVGNQLLDLSYMKYEALKALFKDGDNVEILIRKAQKGE